MGSSVKNSVKIAPMASEFPPIPPIEGILFATGSAGISAGITYKNRDDVVLIHACAGSQIAGVFTRSATRAACVLDCQSKLPSSIDSPPDKPIGIVVNSGNANAFTGAQGLASVVEIVRTTADVLKTEPSRIFTSSTGVIGEPLDPAPICAMLPDLHGNLRDDSVASAAKAIMTTDTFAKGAYRQITIDGQPILIGGFAKGSGMIAPDMATMLAYIFTDARVAQPDLQAMLTATNETSFNAISVDGDTSTSDALMMIATGKSGVDASDNADFRTALGEVMRELAQAIVRDGEGATKLITIKITGATSPQSAKIIAQSIANSPLVKTAIAGEDPNWGRIVMAVGKAGQPADRDKLRIWFGDILVAEHGAVAVGYDEQTTADYMKNERIDLHVDLAIGTGDFTMWSCDFTHDYIRINADYRS